MVRALRFYFAGEGGDILNAVEGLAEIRTVGIKRPLIADDVSDLTQTSSMSCASPPLDLGPAFDRVQNVAALACEIEAQRPDHVPAAGCARTPWRSSPASPGCLSAACA